jgi:nitrite reductase/ring-hydroxylating ferredoxin subunit
MASDINPANDTDCTACPLHTASDELQFDGISRRNFVSLSMLSAIAATLSACGGGELSAAEKLLAAAPTPTTPTTPTTPATPTTPTTPTQPGNPTVGANQIGVTIANYPALANVGGVAKVNSSPPVAVARTATGFVAYSLRCPHQGTTVTIVGTTSWKCPNHAATFNGTGAWTGGQSSAALVKRTVTPNQAGTFVVVNLT